MTPATIIQKAQADGVRLAMSTAGTVKASGNSATVNRWLAAIREHKAEIIDVLKLGTNDAPSVPMTAEEEAAIRAWLEHIEETDTEIIVGVMDKCQLDSETRAYYLWRSEKVPNPDPWHITHCEDCSHFERIDHPHLGHCAKGEPEAIAGLWDTGRRYCERYLPRPQQSHYDLPKLVRAETKK